MKIEDKRLEKRAFLRGKSVVAIFELGKKQAFRGNGKMCVDSKNCETIKKVFY